MSVLSVTSAMNVTLFALAVVAVAVGALDDAGRALGVVMTVVAGIGFVDQVADDEQKGANEERERLHCEIELVLFFVYKSTKNVWYCLVFLLAFITISLWNCFWCSLCEITMLNDVMLKERLTLYIIRTMR
jgi:hypothetical protein